MAMIDMQGMGDEDFKGGGAGDRPEPGLYHVAVDWCNEKPDENRIDVAFVVLAGKPLRKDAADQAGKQIVMKLFLSSGKGEKETRTLIRQLGRFARIAGLIDKKDVGQQREVDFTASAGAQFIIKVEPHKFTNKEGIEVATVQVPFFGFWQIGDKDVQGAVIDSGMWEAATNRNVERIDDGGAKASGSASTPTTTNGKPQPAMAGAAAGAGEFDDI